MQKRTGPNRRGIFLLTLTVFLACLLCLFLGAQAAAPFMDADSLARANDSVAAQVKRLQLQNQRDERAIALAKTNAGIERKARESGWMRPEERAVPYSALCAANTITDGETPSQFYGKAFFFS